jgi:uncharacterized protein (TIGR00290 family)
MIQAYMNWSGGKDSSLALYRVMRDKQYQVGCLLTSVNAAHDRISMHGVRRGLLQQQAEAIGLPLTTIELPEHPSMEAYEAALLVKVQELRQQYTHALFGDIFLEDLRKYREEQLHRAGITAAFPLWQEDSTVLMQEFLQTGFKAVVVCVNEQHLPAAFCGRIIDESFVRDLPAGVDVCGENGEYHSFVFDGPVFRHPVAYTKGEVVYKTYPGPGSSDYGFYFCDLLPA